MNGETTEVKTISDSELDELLQMPGAEDVITPSSNVFSPAKEPEFEPVDPKEKDIVDEIIEVEPAEKPEPPAKTKTQSDYLESFIKDGTFFLFDDDKPFAEYTAKDKEELIKANLERIRKDESDKAPVEFYENLPQELQYAGKYIAEGGQDLKGLFRVLAGMEEAKELNPATPEGQEEIVRTFMRLNNLGTPEEITQEINDLKDMPGALEKKAAQYKPKVDAKYQEQLDKKIKDQEEFRKKQEVLAVKYKESVANALQPGEIGGIKITPSIQNKLFSGLTEVNYQSAISGRPTNQFGHLLEKHQYIEPKPSLMAEVLWLMEDPDGYKNAVRKAAKEENAAETVRQLKTTAAEKQGTSTPASPKNPTKTVVKPKANPFSIKT